MTTQRQIKNIDGVRSVWCGKKVKLDGQIKKESTSAAFLTSEVGDCGYKGAYEDIVIMEDDGTVVVYVRGQKTGRDDHIIINSIDNHEKIYIIHRLRSKKAFKVIGKGLGSIYRERSIPVGQTTEDINYMSLFRVLIKPEDVQNIVCPVPVTERGRMFKIGGLRQIGYQHTSIQTCFYNSN